MPHDNAGCVMVLALSGSLLPPHVLTVSDENATIGEGNSFNSFTVSTRRGNGQCDGLFSLAIGPPCRIRIAHIGSASDSVGW